MPRYTNDRFCHNQNLCHLSGVGKYDIPIIEPEEYAPIEWIGFSFASTQRDRENVGIHFFIHDFLFERVWEYLPRYDDMFMKFSAIMTPDFSTYTDWPVALQIYNHWRKHFIGAYLQSKGMCVYPTISWSDHNSYEWCFTGEPRNATVAVSSVGTQKNKEASKLFLDGYEAMIKRLRPKTILFYGEVPKELSSEQCIIRIEPFMKKLRRRANYG